MSEGIANEPEAIVVPVYIHEVCAHLKCLHGDLDPQIKNTNMEITRYREGQ